MPRFLVVTAAALMIAAGGLIGCKKEEPVADNRTPGEKTRDAIDKAGQNAGAAVGKAVDATDNAAKAAAAKVEAATQPSADTAIKSTRTALAGAAEAAVTDNGINDVIKHFAKADRDRIGTVEKSTLADLNAAIDKFRADWKAKYGQDFKLKDKEEIVFGTPVVIQVGNPEIASAAPADANAVNNMTTVSFPAEGSTKPVTLHLVNDGPVMKHYKIEVPGTLDGTKLRESLLKHISEVDGMKDQWPTDVNLASRIVAQHIFIAITEAQ